MPSHRHTRPLFSASGMMPKAFSRVGPCGTPQEKRFAPYEKDTNSACRIGRKSPLQSIHHNPFTEKSSFPVLRDNGREPMPTGEIFSPDRKKKLASRFGFAYTSFRAEVVELVDTLS